MANRRIVGCVVGLMVFLTCCDTDNNVENPSHKYFVKYYGGDGNQAGVDMITKDDGDILLLGNWAPDNDESRIYLVDVNAEGVIQWERKLGTSQDRARDIERTNDGNYIILSDVGPASATDIKLIRITPDGNKIDSVVYGSPGIENARTVTQLTDNGFIVTGATEYDTTNVLNPGNEDDLSDIFHYRCNQNLVFNRFNWYEQYGPGTLDFGTKVIQNKSDQFYVFGTSNQIHPGNPQGNLNMVYYSVGGGGIIQNVSFLGDFDNDTESSFVMQVPDALGGGLFIAGTESTSAGAMNLHVTKLRTPLVFSPSNDELFDTSIPIGSKKLSPVAGAASVHDIQGYLLVANELQEDGTTNIWITKIRQSDGGVLWSSTYGTDEKNDSAAAVQQLQDGTILVLGTGGLVNNQSKMVLMKLNFSGQLMD
jgi:hypothetical protein